MDSISFPLRVIDEILTDCQFKGKDPQDAVKGHFEALFAQHRDQIPLLTKETLPFIPSSSLVRYRCMVQDLSEPELFSPALKTRDGRLLWGLWRDGIDLPQGVAEEDVLMANEHAERQPVYGILPPNQSDWAKETPSLPYPRMVEEQRERGPKRGREDEMEVVSEGAGPRAKQAREEREEQEKLGGGGTGGPKGKDSHTPRKTHTMGPNEESLRVLIKCYGDATPFRLNTLVEFCGILAPLEAPAPSEEDRDSWWVPPPPSSLVPRLHAVCASLLGAGHPLLPSDESARSLLVSSSLSSFSLARRSLVSALTSALGQDPIAAEFLVLWALSRVHGRAPGLAIGALPVNLTVAPLTPELASHVESLVQTLFPRCLSLPLSRAWLGSSTRILPSKDYTEERLLPGLLQLPAGTALLLNEGALETGPLPEGALPKLGALADLLQFQRAQYDFGFFQHEFEADLPILVLSEGASLFRQAGLLRVPLRPLSQFKPLEADAKTLNQWRIYLGLAREHHPAAVSTSLSDHISANWVEERQRDSSATPEQLHRRLTLLRLVAAAEGATEPTAQHWEEVKRLEQARLSRIEGLKI